MRGADSIGPMITRASIWWPWGAAMAGWFVSSIVMGIIRTLKRAQNMAGAAQELGLKFTAWMGPESAPRFGTELFQSGSAGGCHDVMTGNFAGLDVQVFDYSRNTGVPGYSTNTARTVAVTVAQTVAVYTQNVDLPAFTLEAASFAGKIVDAIQHQKVDLDSAPDFSRQYAVHGVEKDRIRSLFNDRLVSFLGGLDRSHGWHIEGAGKALVLYRYGRRVKPAELRDFLQETSTIAQSFFAYAGAKAASVVAEQDPGKGPSHGKWSVSVKVGGF